MSRLSITMSLFVWSLAFSLNAAEPVFRFNRPVISKPVEEDSLLSIMFDSEVYVATRDGFPDVRLFDTSENSIPFLMRKVIETRPRSIRSHIWQATQITLSPLDNGGLEIELTLRSDDPQPNGLTLATPLKNFSQRVRVFTSSDGKEWQPAGQESAIFDYTRYMDVRNESVSFPETAHRHFRIVIDDVTAEQESELVELTRHLKGGGEVDRSEKIVVDRRPFRIDRIDLWRDVVQEQIKGDMKRTYPVTKFSVSEDVQKKQTVVTLDVKREPVTSFELVTTSRNFSRHAVVEAQKSAALKASDQDATWLRIGEGTLTYLNFKNTRREQLSIAFPESRYERYRIVIDNRDSPVLDVAGIKAEGNVYELVCLTSKMPHHLAYSSDDCEPPRFDTASIQTLLGQGYQPVAVELGPQEISTQEAAHKPFAWSSLINDPRLLVAVIGVLVVLLAWGLYHASKRMDNLPPES